MGTIFKQDNAFRFLNIEGSLSKKIKSGFYNLVWEPLSGEISLHKTQLVSDEILDLPSEAYTSLISQFKSFLTPGKKKQFEDMGYVYKRSLLLHGIPGTGKTCLVNRFARYALSLGAVCIFANHPRAIKEIVSKLKDIQPETLVVIIMEEFEEIVRKGESDLLILLDGQLQRDNTIYLATTNYLKRIPPRVLRPGRMSSTIEVCLPTVKEREYYLQNKLNLTGQELLLYTNKSDGMSIDELKELVQSTKLLDVPLQECVDRIFKSKASIGQELSSSYSANLKVPQLEYSYRIEEDESCVEVNEVGE